VRGKAFIIIGRAKSKLRQKMTPICKSKKEKKNETTITKEIDL